LVAKGSDIWPVTAGTRRRWKREGLLPIISLRCYKGILGEYSKC